MTDELFAETIECNECGRQGDETHLVAKNETSEEFICCPGCGSDDIVGIEYDEGED